MKIDSNMRNVFSDFFKMRIPLEKSFYIDKIGLDAGCGEGRYSWEMSNQGCEIISMDLSESVNTAYRNNIKNKKVHVIQGSIYSPPINKSSLDFVISHGVIHHLPDPKEGFNNLTPLVKEEGDMVIWVYGLEQMDLIYKLSHFTFLRSFTSWMGPFTCFGLSLFLASLIQIFVWWPARIISLSGLNMPSQIRETSVLPFIWKVHEIQDRLGVPVTFYPTNKELYTWFSDNDFDKISVRNTDKRGWFARGRK